MNTTNGKIAEQSRQSFLSALLTLMKQYDFKGITITQISQEATLSRKTFYKLFPDKEAVLKYLLEQKTLIFLETVKEKDIHHYWDLVKCLFAFWEQEKELLLLLRKHDLLYLINQVSHSYSAKTFEIVRSRQTADKFAPNLPYLFAYSLGGMHSLLLKWIEDGMNSDYNIFIDVLHKGFQSIDI